jgi:undecaprenyl-diphosphatase
VPFLQAVALGIVQGVTEFLPISSDGHLWIVYRLFGDQPNLTFEIFLHFATLLVLVAYFWRDIVELLSSLLPANRERRTDRRLVALIALGTLVSGAIAAFMGPVVDEANTSGMWVGLGFLLTSVLMAIAELMSARVTRMHDAGDLPLWRAVPVGVLQALAVLPGVSRSGSTISGGMYSGLARVSAARFSFLLGIPIIALATLKDGLEVLAGTSVLPPLVPSAVGFVMAAAAGYLAIWGLLAFVKRHSLYWFVAYTGLLGTAILVMTVVA